MPGIAPRPPSNGTGPPATGPGGTEPDVTALTRVDPKRLLVFREVGHGGSMAAAARTLGWTQPAVSKHVRRLERDVGLPLIIRAGRGIALTDAGRLLLRHADSVATGLAAADRAMTDLAGLRSGRVRLAAFPSAGATVVAAAVSSLAAAHPGLDVQLTQVEPPAARALLARGEVDVAVVFDYPDQPVPDDHAGAASVPLMVDEWCVVVPTDHPFAGRSAVGLPDLAAERWIAGCPDCRQHLLRSAARAGFTPDIRHSTDDYIVVQALVAAGVAVAALPGLALAASRRPGINVLPLTGHPPRTVSAVLHADSRATPALATTIEHLSQAAHRHRPPGSVPGRAETPPLSRSTARRCG